MTRYSTIPDVHGYPENSPFDMDPPLYNLVPKPNDSGRYDTAQLVAEAKAIAEKTDINPFLSMYGSNPLMLEGDIRVVHMPMNAYREPPTLPEISLPHDFTFIEQINPNGNSPVFMVAFNGEICLLKIVSPRRSVPIKACLMMKTVSRSSSSRGQTSYEGYLGLPLPAGSTRPLSTGVRCVRASPPLRRMQKGPSPALPRMADPGPAPR